MPMPAKGGSQLPSMLPPLTSAMAGPLKMGQRHSAAGNDGRLPSGPLTSIVSPVGVHVEAAQRANSPMQIRKSSWKAPWARAGDAVPSRSTASGARASPVISRDMGTVPPRASLGRLAALLGPALELLAHLVTGGQVLRELV